MITYSAVGFTIPSTPAERPRLTVLSEVMTMNVIGIVQTDLNEFNILFEDPSAQNDGGESGFFSFSDQQDQRGGDDQQHNLQELTVRIKGVPEGQKATFLQMYQIIQDAKEMRDLAQNVTIVSQGNEQNKQGQGRGGGRKQ